MIYIYLNMMIVVPDSAANAKFKYKRGKKMTRNWTKE